MSSNRDPLTNPATGDRVRGIWKSPQLHQGMPETLTVQAVVGNLVAFTVVSNRRSEILWETLDNWCQPDQWLSGWEVLQPVQHGQHAFNEACLELLEDPKVGRWALSKLMNIQCYSNGSIGPETCDNPDCRRCAAISMFKIAVGEAGHAD